MSKKVKSLIAQYREASKAVNDGLNSSTRLVKLQTRINGMKAKIENGIAGAEAKRLDAMFASAKKAEANVNDPYLGAYDMMKDVYEAATKKDSIDALLMRAEIEKDEMVNKVKDTPLEDSIPTIEEFYREAKILPLVKLYKIGEFLSKQKLIEEPIVFHSFKVVESRLGISRAESSKVVVSEA